MKLYIAGIFHFDPRCMSAVDNWLRRRVVMASSGPAFVANEWSRAAFQAVQPQRPYFRRLLESEWPDASPTVLDILERSLAYEGDAHLGVCPDAEVLWLGKAEPASGALRTYADDRLAMYRAFLAGAPMPTDPEVAVGLLGAAARRVATSEPNHQRDRGLASAIMDRAEGALGAWAGVVVGANHAADTDDSMLRVLRDHGSSCEVEIL